MRLWLIVGVLALPACVSDTPTLPDVSGDGSVELDGGYDAKPPVCEETFARCAGPNTLEKCALGQAKQTTECGFGCLDSSCRPIAPSGAVDVAAISTATADAKWELAKTYTFNVDTGEIATPNEIIRQPGTTDYLGMTYRTVNQVEHPSLKTFNPSVAIFGFRSLLLGKDAIIRFVGSRPVAIGSLTDITIEGQVLAGAECTANTAGPGGYAGGSPNKAGAGPGGGKPAGADDFARFCGAAGGGNGTAGANGLTTGCNSTQSAPGGLEYPSVLSMPFVLLGGSGGGGGGINSNVNQSGDDAYWAPGGAGGGGLHIFANGTITIKGVVDAGACGGRALGGKKEGGQDRCRGSGGGGGAGGTILIEGSVVALDPAGKVTANGGAGAGPSDNDLPGTPGGNATQTTTPAQGGAGTSACVMGRQGGNGGALTPPTQGMQCNGGPSEQSAGGSGGAAGRILVGALPGKRMLSGNISPAPTLTDTKAK